MRSHVSAKREQRVIPNQNEAFEIDYIGEEYGFEPKPPTSAKLVAIVSWGWAPGHDRTECYLLCSDRKRTGWTLWAKAYDECSDKLMYSRLACGAPYRRDGAKWAAEQLLTAAWIGERDGYLSDLRGTHVDQSALPTLRLNKLQTSIVRAEQFTAKGRSLSNLSAWEPKHRLMRPNSLNQAKRTHYASTYARLFALTTMASLRV
jgi:hypothetical protein